MNIIKSRIILFFFFALLIVFPVLAQGREGDLAVMEITFSGPGLSKKQIQFLSDDIREKASKLTNYRVMTGESLQAILKAKKIEFSCADNQCELQFGQEIEADKLITANLLFSDGTYYLNLKYFDVGNLGLDKSVSRECKGCDFGKLRNLIRDAAQELLGGIKKIEPAQTPGFVTPGGAPGETGEAGITEITPTQVAAAASGPAILYITTVPSGADVYLGKLKAGNTEPAFQKTDLEPGKVIQITLQKNDYHPLIFPVELKPGSIKYEGLKLKPNFGTLEIISEPPGAKVEIGGEVVGATPYRSEKIKSGEYLVSVSLDLYEPVKNQGALVEDEKKTVKNYPLSPNFGTVSVESDPPGAGIFLGRLEAGRTAAPEDRGKTPGTLKLSPGQYELSLKLEGYRPKTFKLLVARGKQAAITREQGKLIQMVGSLSVSADPPEPGAKVYLDGVESGSAPITLDRIPAGSHKVEVKKVREPLRGLPSKEGGQDVDIADGKMTSVTIKLKESFGGGEMVLIPAGEFMMGCNSSVDKQCSNDEKPYHRVYLDAYKVDKYEVAVADYEKCVNAGKCEAPSTGGSCNWGNSGLGNHPVNCVDWNQASGYCEWAGKRLPTEAEWEKAARGTDGKVYPYGNQFDCGKSCNSVKPCDHSSTCPAGSYAEDKSPYGVMDMAGNVWEWVQDWYEEGYYKNSPAQNPQGPSSGTSRALRGGSWNTYYPENLRASHRYWGDPEVRSIVNGFRCVRRVN